MSVTKKIGLEGVAIPVTSAQDYVNRAVSLVADVPALDALHKNLRTAVQNSANIRPKMYTRALEEKFEKLLSEKTNAPA